MKLFKCLKCGNYSNSIYVTVPMDVQIKLHTSDGSWSISEVRPAPDQVRIEKLYLAGTRCPGCEGSMELVEVERCPHGSGADCWDYRGAKRVCRLCDEEQRAETVIFGDVQTI